MRCTRWRLSLIRSTWYCNRVPAERGCILILTQLNDVISLLVGLWAVKVANEKTNSKKYTYGVSSFVVLKLTQH